MDGVVQPALPAAPRARRPTPGAAAVALVMAAAFALRMVCVAAYPRSALTFVDSWRYLQYARHLAPDPMRPAGYSLWLRVLFGSAPNLYAVVIVQHLLGLACGVGIYLLLRRYQVRRGFALLAAAPVLYDGFQLDIEQYVLSETAFDAFLLAALLLLLWWRRPPVPAALAAGVFLSLATLVRSVGIVLLLVVLGYAVLSRWGWARLTLLAAGIAVPLLGYATWFAADEGSFALERFSGYAAYSRVSTFADCRGLHLPTSERELCITTPRGHRPSPSFYAWDGRSPLQRYERRHHLRGLSQTGNPSAAMNAVAESFSRAIILHQPLDYADSVVAEVTRYLGPTRSPGKFGYPLTTWRFPLGPAWGIAGQEWVVRGAAKTDLAPPSSFVQFTDHTIVIPTAAHGARAAAVEYARGSGNRTLDRALRSYQALVNVPGTPLAVALLLALLMQWKRLAATCQRRRLALLLALAGLALIIETAMSTIVEFRYLLPLLILMPPVWAVAADTLWTNWRERRTASNAKPAE